MSRAVAGSAPPPPATRPGASLPSGEAAGAAAPVALAVDGSSALLFSPSVSSAVQGGGKRRACIRVSEHPAASRNTPLKFARGELGHDLVHAPPTTDETDAPECQAKSPIRPLGHHFELPK